MRAEADPAVGSVAPIDAGPGGPVRHPLAVAAAVAALHGLNDAYTAFLPPLLPRMMDKMGLSITLAATLMLTLSLASSLTQPLLGHLADRRGRRLMVVGGPILSAVFLSLMGLAPTFAVLIALLAIGGLGSAAFHPTGASMAVRAHAGRGSGVRHAVFSFGGAAGYAIGPLLVVALVARRGLEGIWVAMLPTLILAVALYFVLPDGTGRSAGSPAPPSRGVLRLLRGPLGLVFAISVASAFVQRLFLTLEPIIVATAGGSERTGAVVLTAYLVGQAVGTLAGGVLADRMDRRRLLAALCALSVPLHVLAYLLPPGSAASLVAAAAAGFVNQAILPPVVVIALELTPGSAALSSGLVMGLAWAAGSVGVLGAGVVADLAGPLPAAVALTPLGLVGAWLALRPALDAHRRPPPEPA